MRRFFAITLLTLVMLSIQCNIVLSTAAQETTPTPVPPADPTLCPHETRITQDQIVTLLATPPAGTPAPPVSYGDPAMTPMGEPADEAIVAEVVATFLAFYACQNANDIPAALAFYAEDTLRYLLAPAQGQETTATYAFLDETPPPPRPRPDWVGVSTVRDVSVFPDGKIGATVVTTNDPGAERTTFIYLTRKDGALRIVTPLFGIGGYGLDGEVVTTGTATPEAP